MPSLAISSGGITPSKYAPVEVPRLGALAKGRSVRAAPPTTSLSSSTTTWRPARAKRSAATRPLCPAPTTTTSARSMAGTLPRTATVLASRSGDGVGLGRLLRRVDRGHVGPELRERTEHAVGGLGRLRPNRVHGEGAVVDIELIEIVFGDLG